MYEPRAGLGNSYSRADNYQPLLRSSSSNQSCSVTEWLFRHLLLMCAPYNDRLYLLDYRRCVCSEVQRAKSTIDTSVTYIKLRWKPLTYKLYPRFGFCPITGKRNWTPSSLPCFTSLCLSYAVFTFLELSHYSRLLSCFFSMLCMSESPTKQ